MLIIPGWLISALTFPGVMVHEWAHKKFCDWCGVKVLETIYFRFSTDEDVAGYVKHESPSTYFQTVLISVGPLLINSLIGVFLAGLASNLLEIRQEPWAFILYWLALSIGMHAFPSDHDADHIDLASKSKAKQGHPVYLLAIPFLGLIKIANKFGAFLGIVWAITLILVGSALGGIIFGWLSGI